MKRYNRFDHHMILLGIIIPFLVFFISMNATFAYFTATAAKNESSSETAMLKINFSAATAGEVYTSTQTKATRILPGDTLKITGALENSGTADCYVVLEYELKITKQNSGYTETLEKQYYTLSDSGWTEVYGTPGNYTPNSAIFSHESGSNSKAINFEYTFDAEQYGNEYKNATVKYTLSANAIQTSNITQSEAMDMLMENIGYSSSKIYGNSIQETKTGKNLLNPKDNVQGSLNINDGSIHTSLNFVSTSDFIPLSAGTYTISYKTGANLRYVAMYNNSKEIIDNIWTSRKNPFSFTLSQDCLVRIDVERDGNIEITNFATFFSDYEVQLESGSTATAYEPYCGGAPSPSPTNPAEIQSVGDKTNNLINENNYTASRLWTIESGVYTSVDNNYNNLEFGGITIEAGKTYTLACEVLVPNNHYYYRLRSGATNVSSQVNVSTKGQKWLTFTANATYPDVKLQCFGTIQSSGEFSFTKPQLIEGAEITPYEPYGKYKIPVNIQGKNLFNINTPYDNSINCSYSIGGTTILVEPIDDKLTRLVTQVQVTPNTNYVFSCTFEMFNTADFAGGSSIYIREGATSGTILAARGFQIKEGEQKISLPFNSGEYSTLYLWFYYNQVNNGTQTNGSSYGIYKNIQLESGTEATEYAPYIGEKVIYLDEPLRRIGDVADYIDLETGEVVRQVGSINENTTITSFKCEATKTGMYRSLISSQNIMASGTKLAGISNVLPCNVQAWDNWTREQIHLGQNNGAIYIITSSYFADWNSLKDYLTNNGKNELEINYILKTPYIDENEKIESLGVDFDKGYSIQSYDTSVSYIPSEYQQVQYIQSSGTDYIDIGYVPNDTTNVVYDYEFISGNENTWTPILGQRTNGSPISHAFAFWVNSSSALFAINYNGTDSGGISGTSCFKRNVYSNDGTKFYINNTLVKEFTAGTFEGSSTLTVFGCNVGTSIDTRNSVGKVYSLKIYETNQLVRNLVPCYRVSDNKIGLYDTVTNQFYSNSATTDNLTKGANV